MTTIPLPEIEAAIWERIIHPEGELPAPVAQAILKLHFSTADRKRMHRLATKAQREGLTPAEEVEAENYERVGSLLSILKSRARQVLKRNGRTR